MSETLEELLRRREMESPNRASAAVRAAASSNPDEAGRNATLARRFNVTPDVVAANPQLFSSTQTSEDANALIQREPRLADWLSARENNARIAHDDLQNLSSIQQEINRAGPDPSRWTPQLLQRGLYLAGRRQQERAQRVLSAQALQRASDAEFEGRWYIAPLANIARGVDSVALSDPVLPKVIDAYNSGELRPDRLVVNISRAIAAGVTQLASGATGLVQAGAELMNDYSPVAWAERQLFGGSLEGAIGSTAGNIRQSLDIASENIRPQASSQLMRDVYGGIESLPLTAASLAGGIYTRSARVAAMITGADVGGQSYGRARNEGLSPTAAFLYGATDAAIETLTERIPLGVVIHEVEAGSTFMRRYLRSLLAEVPTEQAATFLQDFNAWVAIEANQGKTFEQFMAERPQAALSTFVATLVNTTAVNAGVSATEAVARRMGRTMVRVNMAEENQQMLQRLSELAAASRVRERDTGSFAEFVRHAADGTEATDVYIDARELSNIFHQGQVTPDEAATMTGMSPTELAQAVARGDDVRIPIEQYAAHIAAHEINSQMLQHLRTDPEGMSVAEAKTYMQGATEAFAAEAEAAFGSAENVDAARASMDRVRDNFVEQLARVNRFTSDVNTAYATMIASFYATTGSRLGLTAEQMAERYPLQVQSGVVPAASFDQSQQPALLNIGLNTNDGSGIAKEHVLDALKQVGVQVLSADQHKSDTEDTLAIRLDRALTPEEAHAVSVALKQEAIAQFAGGVGELHGPQAEGWRPFNPQFFIMPDGSRMSSSEPPLKGLPQEITVDGKKVRFGPFAPARAAAERYMARAGMPYAPPTNYVRVDPERAKRIADAFDAMQHAPDDPMVEAAYAAMIAETIAQWQTIKETGLHVEFITGDDPYGNPRNAILDVVNNNHLWVYPTDTGFGTEGDNYPGNPLLAIVEGEEISGRQVRVNDIFRIVHDYFGHIKDGVGFRADGEENAWRSHASMYSPLARQAMTTETRGQNSWVNYGPHGEANRNASPEDTKYAAQKIGLLPTWAIEEGATDATYDQATMPADNTARASWTNDRFEMILRSMAYISDVVTGRENFAKGYVVMMSPDQFLGLTLSAKGRDLVDKRVNSLEEYGGGELDQAKLAAAEPIHLMVGHGAAGNRFGPQAMGVVGHEGRHRMTILKNAGVSEVPVVIHVAGEAADRSMLNHMRLFPQRAGRETSRYENGDTETTVYGLQPMSWVNRENARRLATRDGLYFQDMIFYSALERAVEQSMTKKASAEQWEATLRKTPGVKQEELEWSGLLDFLAMQEGPVERDALLELVRAGGIKVDEVLLSHPNSSEFINDPEFEASVEAAIEEAEQEARDTFYNYSEGGSVYTYKIETEDESGNTVAKWVLFSEGSRIDPNESYDSEDDAQEVADEYNMQEENEALDDYLRSEVDAERIRELMQEQWFYDRETQFASWSSDPDNDTYRELLITLPQSVGNNPSRTPGTHWNTEAVVAHARFMDKQDANGDRVLFIEEVQSDWHQKGRDEGYETTLSAEEMAARDADLSAAEAALAAAERVLVEEGGKALAKWREVTGDIEALNEYGKRAVERYDALPAHSLFVTLASDEQIAHEQAVRAQSVRHMLMTSSFDFMVKEEIAAFDAATLRVNEARQAASRRTEGFIPNAPFKSTWPALVMKRMIRYAVDNGYKKIAWTTGEEQAERYNLSQAVGSITIKRSAEGTAARSNGEYRVMFANTSVADTLRENGMAQRSRDNATAVMTADQLKQAFGADIAKRLIEGAEAAPIDQFLSVTAQDGSKLEEPGVFKLEGAEDLRVGGEGMKAFYDRNLVNITNDLIKKHGGKVGAIKLESEVSQRVKGMREDADALVNLGDEQNASHIYDAANQMEAADAPHPGFEITDKLAEVAASGFPLFQSTGAPRGQASFADDITTSPSIITLLRGADLSTFLHESGHFFLEVMTHAASQPDAPQPILNDMRVVLNSFGIDSLSRWQQMSTEERRTYHEQFARSFEAYLFEGNAPSLEMKSLFQRFRQWLLNVYRSISKLNVQLTDEVRGVFDRMLATDDMIAEAEADRGMRPFFADKPDDMSDAEWAAYQEHGLAATREAASELERRSLRDMRFAGRAAGRELKRLQKEIAGKRKAMREEVAADVRQDPVYRAIEYLRTGKIDGEPTEEPMKLSIDAVETLYADRSEEERKAIMKKLGYGANGMLAKDGANPAEIASLFGFTSADHLIQEIQLAPAINVAIDQQTDQAMRERYGDINSPEALQAAVDLAIHNDVRGRFVASELAAMSKAPGKQRVLSAAAKRIASEMIARLKIRNVKPAQYEAAERRAAREAEKLGTTKLAEAAAAKRNQLIQFHAAKEAREALDEIERGRRYLKRFSTEATRKGLDPDYVDQIDALLERYDLRASVTNKAAAKRKSLQEWIEKQREMGFEPQIEDWLLDEAYRIPYREATVEEWRGLIDSIRNIEHLGRLKKQLLTSKAKRELQAAADAVAGSIRTHAYKSVPEIVGSKTWGERFKAGVKDFFQMHRKFANLARTMDGGKGYEGGPMWEYLIRPMNAAGDAETARNEAATIALGDIFKLISNENTTKREYIPELNLSLSLEDRLMIALNWGNSTNRSRIIDGDKWTPAQVESILAPLTSTHWDFVEAIWQHIDSYWPAVAAKERRVSGIVPEKVEAEPFEQTMPDGSTRTIRGGYFPIKYDPDRSSKAEADTAAEILQQMTRGLYARATTRRGHLKERVETVKRPVRKDFGVIFGHVQQVIHDLSWHEYLIDANRLLNTGQIDSAIREHYGPEALRWIKSAIEDIAVGDAPARNGLERAVNHIRTGVSISGLGWNLWTSLLQPLGLSQSMVRIGPAWVGRGMADLLGNPARLNAKLKWVYEQSSFMRLRAKTMQREINEIRNTVTSKSPIRKGLGKIIPAGVSEAVSGSFFVLITKAQLMADLPTWIGQYQKSIAAGEEQERAVALADQAVLDSQGGGQIKDLAGVQRGGPLWKLWTNFYSYFSTTYNLIADRTSDLKRRGPSDLPLFAVDFLMLTAVPATIGAILRSALSGDDEDEMLKRIAEENASYLAGLLIGVREIAAAFKGNAGYNGPAGARLIAELSKLGQQTRQGEVDEPLLRAMNNVAGILLHYPSGQVDRTIRGSIALANGQAGPAAPIIGPPPR